MNLLDIIGPVMVGPSSSHTAGAVKIGRVCHKLLAEKVVRADIFFHGSFLATGKGHGTNAGYYVTRNAGATDKILSMINF